MRPRAGLRQCDRLGLEDWLAQQLDLGIHAGGIAQETEVRDQFGADSIIPRRRFELLVAHVATAFVVVPGQGWIPERTLLDGLTEPQYCGGLPEVLHAFTVRGPKLELKRIIGYALKLDAATAKRLGWILEHQMRIDGAQLEPLQAVPIKGYRTLDPTGPRHGECDRRWMIQVNAPGTSKQ